MQLLSQILQAMQESALLEHCCGLLPLHQQAFLAQHGDYLPVTMTLRGGIKELATTLPADASEWLQAQRRSWDAACGLLDSLRRTSSLVHESARRARPKGAASWASLRSRLELQVAALYRGPCLAFILAAQASQALADRFGACRLGLPHRCIAEDGVLHPLLNLQEGLLYAVPMWRALLAPPPLAAPAASTAAAADAAVQPPPYGAKDVFLLCEHAARQLCALLGGEGEPGGVPNWRAVEAACCALQGMCVALDAMAPHQLQHQHRVLRAMRCMVGLLASWRPTCSGNWEDSEALLVRGCRQLLHAPAGEWGFDSDDEECAESGMRDELARERLAGPPSPELLAALAEGLVPAVERVWRAAASTPDDGARILWLVSGLGSGWASLLAHAPAAQMAGLAATLRKWMALAFSVTEDGGEGGSQEQGSHTAECNRKNAVCLLKLLLTTEDLLSGAGAAAAAGEPTPSVPDQAWLLLVQCMAQWLPVVSRRCLQRLTEGRAVQRLGEDSDDGDDDGHELLHFALDSITWAAQQCRLAREAAAAVAGPDAAAAGAAAAAGTPASPSAAASAAAGGAAGGATVSPAQAFASWRTLLLRDVRALDLCAAALEAAAAGSDALDFAVLAHALDALIAALPEDVRQHLLQGRRHAAAARAGTSGGAALGAAVKPGAPAALACGRGPVWLHLDARVDSLLVLLSVEQGPEFAQLGLLLTVLPEVPEEQAAAFALQIRHRIAAAEGVRRSPGVLLPPPCAAAALLPTCAHPLCANLAGPSEAALQLRDCARCGRVRYCCRDCQLAHWPEHRDACAGRLVWG